MTDEGETVDCKVKGNFRLKGIRSTNPVAVGDRVVIEERGERKDGSSLSSTYITAIEDRRNYIIRKSSNLSKQSHILAANVDQAFLIVTVNYPETSTTFIDRFLASAEAYRVPVVLIFNKVDRLDEDERHLLDMMMQLYETIGYECRAISAATGEGVEELRPLLAGKITLLSGNSGVGKSTLINRLVPGVNLRTAEISDAHKTGMHTTTFSEMIRVAYPQPLPQGRGDEPTPSPSLKGGEKDPLRDEDNGQNVEKQLARQGGEASPSSWLIDTPGIKGFGTFDIEPEELTSYFKEIFQFSKNCKFSNCTHTHEPGCAVLKALEDHYIAQSRYQSYLSMMEDKEEDKYRAPS